MDSKFRWVDHVGDGAAVSFSFDRMTVQRFRKAFPRARWSDWNKAWIVPGKTASRRIDSWLAREASRASPFAEEKGRDAYEFEPILSSYLSVDNDGLRIKTPYSRRNEPEERRKRAEARKGSDEEKRARRRANERRRRRIPLFAEALPPLNRPLATEAYGIIVVREITGELVHCEMIDDVYSDLDGDYVWGIWRLPSLDELIQTWPRKNEVTSNDRQRGWWHPDIEQLREARRSARSRERRAATLVTD